MYLASQLVCPLLQRCTTNCELELHRSFDLMRFDRSSAVHAELCEELNCPNTDSVAIDCFVSAPMHEQHLVSLLTKIKEMSPEDKEESESVERPATDHYLALVVAAEKFAKTVANTATVDKLLSSLSDDSSLSSENQNIIQSAETWQQSVSHFCSNLLRTFSQYGDIIQPCAAAAFEVLAVVVLSVGPGLHFATSVAFVCFGTPCSFAGLQSVATQS